MCLTADPAPETQAEPIYCIRTVRYQRMACHAQSCTASGLSPGGQMLWQADASLDQLVVVDPFRMQNAAPGASSPAPQLASSTSVTPADSGWLDGMQAFD